MEIMEKEELEKYKIRDYYMIPVEVVDNMFYLFEQQCKKQQEVIDKAIEYIEEHSRLEPPEYEYLEFYNKSSLIKLLDILKEVE